MQTTIEKISPSAFNAFAGNNPEAWKTIVGMHVRHGIWGSCSIDGVDLEEAVILINGHTVALSYFRDGIFDYLVVPTVLAEQIRDFENHKADAKSGQPDDNGQQVQQEVRSSKLQGEAVQLSQAPQQERLQPESVPSQPILGFLERKRRLDEVRRAALHPEAGEHQHSAEADKEERRRRDAKLQEELAAIRHSELEQVAKRQEALQAKWRAELEQAAKLQADTRQKRASSIRAFCQEHQITRLLHFTRLQNLSSILSAGLLGRRTLETWSLPRRPNFNDAYRFDGFREAVCLSINFPNYKMFNALSCQDRKKWVVLSLEPYILWEFDCAFFEGNAASNSVKAIPLEDRRQFSALVQMFADQHSYTRQSLAIPDGYTTDPQAEVLVFEPIDPKYIVEIHFYDRITMEDWVADYGQTFPQRCIVNHQYFNARSDYYAWQRPVKNIIPPPPPDEAELIF